jgi:hypothetical protein
MYWSRLANILSENVRLIDDTREYDGLRNQVLRSEERGDEGVGVDDRSASDVYEDGVGREHAEFLLADEPLGRLGQRTGEDNIIGADQGVVERLLVETDHLVRRATFLRRVANTDGFNPESLKSVDNRFTDRAEPDDRDGLPLQLVGFEVLPDAQLLSAHSLV